MISKPKDVHSEIRELLEKHGYYDFYYGGINIDGSRFSGLRVGSDLDNVSNNYRRENLLGHMQHTITEVSLPSWLIKIKNEQSDANGEFEENF